MGKVATQPLPPGESPPLQSGGQNQKWPTSGQDGYITLAAGGIPTASERRAQSKVAHKWARWLHNPCRQGNPHRLRAGGTMKNWPTSGQGGYVTPAAYVVPRGAESEVAHKWARLLNDPCRLGNAHRFRAGGRITKWRTSGQGGYITPTAGGVRIALEGGAESEVAYKWVRWLHNPCRLGNPQRGAKSELAHKWARWLRNPCRLGDPHRFRGGGRIRSGLQVGKVAT